MRSIAQVVSAISNGDFSKKITVSAMGEEREIIDMINKMVDYLVKKEIEHFEQLEQLKQTAK